MIALASHAVAALAYTGFALLILISGNRGGIALWLIGACISTAVWAGWIAVAEWLDIEPGFAAQALETLRSGAWMACLFRILAVRFSEQPNWAPQRVMIFGSVALFGSLLAADAVDSFGPDVEGVATFTLVARVSLPILGLMLIENLARNDRPSAFWATRYLFAGIGGVFAYDLFLYSEALLLQRVNPDLYAARGAINAIAVPMMAVALARNPAWAVDIHVSRQFVFHSMTLVGSGAYLLLMAIAGYYLRIVGGTWGTFLQVLFLASALVIVFLTVSSGTFRSKLRLFISRHFFSYKYDYRREWLELIRMISAQESLLPLHDRVIEAIANIVDSPAGALWVRDTLEERLVNTAAWNVPLQRESHGLDSVMVTYFERYGRPVCLIAGAVDNAAPKAPRLPDWVREMPRAWLVVPLVHRDRFRGLLVLAKARAARELVTEDFDLMATVGRQVASYLAEEQAGNALADARQLEAFNRRFAFVVHDVKNLASQLSLILKNAEKHGDNPDFQRDVVATVRHSVARMNSILEQLGAERRKGANPSTLDLAQLVRTEWIDKPVALGRITFTVRRACSIEADQEQVLRVLHHVVQNGLDAAGTTGTVEITLNVESDFAVLQVKDDGPGMTADFIRDHLFRPFDSTKKSGYGIGAYQARQMVHGMGGRLEVASEPGKGTVIRILLPLGPAQPAPLSQAQPA
jgi:putative PEP-CTERM system histidine kinase